MYKAVIFVTFLFDILNNKKITVELSPPLIILLLAYYWEDKNKVVLSILFTLYILHKIMHF